MGDFDPLAFFKDEIKHDLAHIRIGAVSQMYLVASAMGPQKTLNELIPYIVTISRKEPFCNDEEFLFSIAKQYATIAEQISPQIEDLIPELEFLAAQEKTVIRDEAIASLRAIVERVPTIVPKLLVPCLHRLATKMDFFTARVSACSLLPVAYKNAEADQKEELRKALLTLCHDETPMVRRAAASKLTEFVKVCEKNDLMAETQAQNAKNVMAVYQELSKEDTQDALRVASVLTTEIIADKINAEENIQYTIPVLKDLVADRSWRVRLTVAKHFDTMCIAYGPSIVQEHLLQILVDLMKDAEQEVRKEAVRIIEPCLQMDSSPFSSDQIQTYILPQFQSLGLDSAQPVRAALAQVVGPVAKVLGRDITQRQLLPLITDLMKDEFHDVRLNIIGHAGLICEILGVDGLVHSLLHTIQSLIMDNHWRIRQSVVQQVPKLAELFGVEMFQHKLEALFLSSLRDSVYCVRQAAISNLQKIAETFGPQWTMEHLLQKVTDQYSNNAGYANRVTTLLVLPQVATVMTPDMIQEKIVPLLTKATKDAVPNVRFCACKTIGIILEKHQLDRNFVSTSIKPSLLELEHDPDVDVQFYAQKTLTLM